MWRPFYTLEISQSATSIRALTKQPMLTEI